MKPLYAMIVFVGLSLTSALASLYSYQCTEASLVADMNQALTKTLAMKTEAWITPDTIRDYRRSLKTEVLRKQSFVYYALDDRTKDEMAFKREECRVSELCQLLHGHYLEPKRSKAAPSLPVFCGQLDGVLSLLSTEETW